MESREPHRSDKLALAREVAGSDDAFYKELLRVFLADASARMETVEEAAQNGDKEKAMLLLHSLKGSALSIGAEELAARAVDAERFIGEENAGASRQALDDFREEFEELADLIRQEIGS